MLKPALVESSQQQCHPALVGYPAKHECASRAAWLAVALGVASLLGGCSTLDKKPRPTPSISVEPETRADVWKGVATDADEARIDRLGLAWTEALAEARRSDPRDVEAEGALLRPRSALARPAPTPGSYYCRLVKLGRTKAKAPAFEKFKPFFCYVEVEGDLLTIVKQTGDTRPAGRLWEDQDPNRLIFLGSLALGDEQAPLAYGENPKRDMAGIFERIAPFKWRLVIPWPQDGAKLDVFELTPVPNQPE